jgi:hypothetical protein
VPFVAHAVVAVVAAPGGGDDGGRAQDDGGRARARGDGAIDAAASAALYPQVEDILLRSCAYERCHSGALVGAGLDLSRGADYAAALVSVPSCEYPPLARVQPFDPDRSWIMVKLTADFRPREDDELPFYILFEPDPEWDPEQRGCPGRAADGTPLFGQRMPLTAPNMLPDDELEVIRAWIAAGARR